MRPEHERWEDKLERIPIGGCWIWMGASYRGGYRHFRRKLNGVWRMSKAHHYAYEYHKGPIETGKIVRHICDNPSCVNPEHLLLGTTQDNVDDKVKRGRQKIVGKRSKEFADNVRAHWKRETTQAEYAKQWGISTTQMSRILNYQIWK